MESYISEASHTQKMYKKEEGLNISSNQEASKQLLLSYKKLSDSKKIV